ncbi:hypothetical protein QFZ96_006010 [Paraburkholderia youngii]
MALHFTKGTARGAALFLFASFFLTACGPREEAISTAAAATPPAATSAAPSNKDMAEIGKLAFFDPSLSASGRQSCASCHSPDRAYGPPNGLAVQLGGADMKHYGTRAVPSLRYLRRVPIWTHTYASSAKERMEDGDNMPSGGYTWDGRFDRPADQAAFPLLNPDEMANADAAAVASRLSRSAYAARFRAVFGQDIFSRPADALAALGKSLERFQFDEPSFQPFDSKFDRVLDGKAQFTTQEARGFILSRGYITTRVLLPEQDISTGALKFALVPGVVRAIRFAEPATRGTWKTAFPSREGDLLNLRDFEQGLEQMKRVSSQDVDMKIEPTDVPGESDIVVTVKRAKPWTVVASVDNSGTRATGKLQGNLSLGIDNPLGLNDIFNVGVSQDLEFGDKGLGSHGWNGSYTVPWGYWTGTLSAYTNTYYQQIAGVNTTFVSSGNSQTVDFRLQRVLMRSQNNVLGAQLRLTKRFGESFIEDTAIPQQRRNNTFIEAGLTDRHYFGASQFDGSLAYRQGVDGLGRHQTSTRMVRPTASAWPSSTRSVGCAPAAPLSTR